MAARKKKSAARKSAVKKSAVKKKRATKKAAKARQRRAPAKKAAPARKRRVAVKQAASAASTPARAMAPPPMRMSPALMDIDQRIAIARANLRELAEQATSFAGAASEELTSDRIRTQEERLQSLMQQREALVRQGG